MSYTMPFPSDEDKIKEFFELTPEEQDEVLEDMYGHQIRKNKNNNETGRNNDENEIDDDNDDDVSEELLEQFDNALESIPRHEMKEYLMACAICPAVVADETNEVRFLRSTNYDPESAARRLVEFWAVRVECFGKDRAFKPMTLEGAMKEDIMEMTLMPNLVRILPDDSHGRTILCWDRTGISFKDYDEKLFVRILIFVLFQALKQKKTQNRGIVYVWINRSSAWDLPPRSMSKMLVKGASFATPQKICCLHFIYSSLVMQFVIPVVSAFGSKEMRQRVVQHCCIQTPRTIAALAKYGLSKNNLPKSIGGDWDEKPTWITNCEEILLQRRLEQKKQQRRDKRQRI